MKIVLNEVKKFVKRTTTTQKISEDFPIKTVEDFQELLSRIENDENYYNDVVCLKIFDFIHYMFFNFFFFYRKVIVNI